MLTVIGFSLNKHNCYSRQGRDNCLPTEIKESLAMHEHFFRSYTSARAHFLQSCHKQQLGSVESIQHPELGPDGDIFMDVACFGDERAGKVIVISSGTHGIEGYSGSGLQSMLLHEGTSSRLPSDTRLMMVHGVNPYGFAWQRRTNELNIDLNRNFIDFNNQPVNTDYREIADIFEPEVWQGSGDSIMNTVRAVVKAKGLEWYQSALSGGQYEYPDGMFYGGIAPAWSNQMIRRVAKKYLANASEVVWLDIHTALGPFGTAECIVDYAPGSREFTRSVELWGDRVKSMLSGDSYSAPIAGSMISGLQKAHAEIVGAGLEFGTVSGREVILALIADQWLHRHGDYRSAQGHAIKDMMMNAFYPDSDDWRESIAIIARDVVAQAMNG